MAQKKHKKRHSQSTINAKRQVAEAKLAEEKDRARKRMNPTARSLLVGDAVFLAIVSLLDGKGMLDPFVSGICSIIGVVLLLLGLWFQFGGGRKKSAFRSGDDWPGLK